jgi:replicative DNA helicase
LCRGDLVVIGARPGAGKTAFALWLADLWSDENRVAFFSYEMSAEQMADRVMSHHGGVSIEDIQEGLTPAVADIIRDVVAERVADKKLSVKVAAGLPSAGLIASLRRFAAGGGRVAVIDYLQLACDRSKHGLTYDVTRFTGELKRCALDTNLTIVALSQLNRSSVDHTEIRPPQLHHLRESGSVEQDADVVLLMLALPSLRRFPTAGEWANRNLVGYDLSLSSLDVGEDADDDKRLVFVEAAKVRQGKQRSAPFVFDGRCMRFTPVERQKG